MGWRPAGVAPLSHDLNISQLCPHPTVSPDVGLGVVLLVAAVWEKITPRVGLSEGEVGFHLDMVTVYGYLTYHIHKPETWACFSLRLQGLRRSSETKYLEFS